MKSPSQSQSRNKPRDEIADSVLYNFQIESRTVRLIDDAGKNLGEILTSQARMQATDQGLDLVLVSPDSVPPVAKIIDAKKYIYDLRQAKKSQDKTARINQIHVKEIQLRPVTGDHDLAVKQKNAQQFLEDKNKVKLVMKFRGREIHHARLGLEIINKFIETLQDCKVERPPEMQGKHITVMLIPAKVN